MISNSLPYPGHLDERYLTVYAGKILKTGDLNPHFFRYPSLPIYITVVGFTIGYINAASNLELDNTDDIGTTGFPYFTHPTIVWPAKVIFTLLSVISMFFMAVIAFRAYGNPYLLFLVPLLISLSGTYMKLSYKYLNVDIVGAFFVSALYCYIISTLEKDTFWQKAVIPGIFIGLAISSKYNLFLAVIPAIIAILFYSSNNKGYKILLIFPVMILTFMLMVPYSILDLKSFLDDIAFEIHHYKSGHTGFENSPGFFQFYSYIKDMMRDYGSWTVILTIIGLVSAFRKDWKKASLLVSFPLVFLLFMTTQKVHFARNILAVFEFYALFAAIGLLALYGFLERYSSKVPLVSSSVKKKNAAIILVLTVIFLTVFPVGKVLKWTSSKPDSRNISEQWINRNIEKGSVLIIPKELSMDTRKLETNYQVLPWEVKKMDIGTLYQRTKKLSNVYVLMPRFTPYLKNPSAEKFADIINASSKAIVVKKHFPGTGVLVNHEEPVPNGNPEFSIGVFKPAS